MHLIVLLENIFMLDVNTFYFVSAVGSQPIRLVVHATDARAMLSFGPRLTLL